MIKVHNIKRILIMFIQVCSLQSNNHRNICTSKTALSPRNYNPDLASSKLWKKQNEQKTNKRLLNSHGTWSNITIISSLEGLRTSFPITLFKLTGKHTALQ